MNEREEKDFHVTIRVKNNRILKAMRRCDIKTIKHLSELSGVPVGTLGMIITFKRRPTNCGDWSDAAFAISSALHCEPEELWPDSIKNLITDKSCVCLEADGVDLFTLVNAKAEARLVGQAITELSDREKYVIQQRFGFDGPDRTLSDVGGDIGISPERTRQIEANALRQIRRYVFRCEKNAEKVAKESGFL